MRMTRRRRGQDYEFFAVFTGCYYQGVLAGQLAGKLLDQRRLLSSHRLSWASRLIFCRF